MFYLFFFFFRKAMLLNKKFKMKHWLVHCLWWWNRGAISSGFYVQWLCACTGWSAEFGYSAGRNETRGNSSWCSCAVRMKVIFFSLFGWNIFISLFGWIFLLVYSYIFFSFAGIFFIIFFTYLHLLLTKTMLQFVHA